MTVTSRIPGSLNASAKTRKSLGYSIPLQNFQSNEETDQTRPAIFTIFSPLFSLSDFDLLDSFNNSVVFSVLVRLFLFLLRHRKCYLIDKVLTFLLPVRGFSEHHLALNEHTPVKTPLSY